MSAGVLTAEGLAALRARLAQIARGPLTVAEAADVRLAAGLLADLEPWRSWNARPSTGDVLVARAGTGRWSRGTIFTTGDVIIHGGRWVPTHFRPMVTLPGSDR